MSGLALKEDDLQQFVKLLVSFVVLSDHALVVGFEVRGLLADLQI